MSRGAYRSAAISGRRRTGRSRQGGGQDKRSYPHPQCRKREGGGWFPLEIEAERLDDPPGLSELRYTLTLVSPESIEKLRQLHELCVKWGTVTNTLMSGVQPTGTLRVQRPEN